MDFITKLPRTARGVDSIWVIIDRLTKSVHFILIVESISAEKPVDIYICEVVVWHWVLVLVILDQDVRFTSTFWKKFHEDLGAQLHFSMTYHPRLMDKVSG